MELVSKAISHTIVIVMVAASWSTSPVLLLRKGIIFRLGYRGNYHQAVFDLDSNCTEMGCHPRSLNDSMG